MMRLLYNANRFANENMAPLFSTSRPLANCAVPWFITLCESNEWWAVETMRFFFIISPHTFQFVTSLRLVIKSRADFEQLMNLNCFQQLFPHLQHLTLSEKNIATDTFAGVETAQFCRKFRRLDTLRIQFWHVENIDWNEAMALFSNLLTPPYPQSGSKMIVSLVTSLFSVAYKCVKSGHKDPSHSIPPLNAFLEALVDFNIVCKLQDLMLLFYRSNDQNVNDGKSLPEFLDALAQFSTVKNLLSRHFPHDEALLHNFLSVDELAPTFELIGTLNTNGDLSTRRYCDSSHDPSKDLVTMTAAFMASFCSRFGKQGSLDPQGLEFMQRYGRRLLPSLLDSVVSAEHRETQTTPYKNVVSMLHSFAYMYQDAYWVDGLETPDDVRRMIDVDGRQVLAHYPFEQISLLLDDEEDDEGSRWKPLKMEAVEDDQGEGDDDVELFEEVEQHVVQGGYFEFLQVSAWCLQVAAKYLKHTSMLADAGAADLPEFVEKYNFPFRLLQKAFRYLQGNNLLSATHEICLWQNILVAVVDMVSVKNISPDNTFVCRCHQSILGPNCEGIQELIVPCVEKTFEVCRRQMRDCEIKWEQGDESPSQPTLEQYSASKYLYGHWWEIISAFITLHPATDDESGLAALSKLQKRVETENQAAIDRIEQFTFSRVERILLRELGAAAMRIVNAQLT